MSQAQSAKSELARRRTKALRNVEVGELRASPALEAIARAATIVCNVPMAHVSVIEEEHQQIIGHIGMGYGEYSRNRGVLAGAMRSDRIVIIEDVTDNEQFDSTVFEDYSEEIRFFAAIPLLVDDTPVGTLTLLDTESRQLDQIRRAALFGLVRQVESHLRIHRRAASPDDPSHRLSSRLTKMVARAIRLRWSGSVDDAGKDVLDRLDDDIAEARGILESLVERAPSSGRATNASFGRSEVPPDTVQSDALGYVETEVDEE